MTSNFQSCCRFGLFSLCVRGTVLLILAAITSGCHCHSDHTETTSLASESETSLTAISYNRAGALSYARKYWNRVCSDNVIGVKTTPFYKSVPATTTLKQTIQNGTVQDENAVDPSGRVLVTLDDMEDCTHFISCCLGTPPNDSAGGLNIKRDFSPIYGRLSADRLFHDISASAIPGAEIIAEKVDEKTAESLLQKLLPGDLIFYWDSSVNMYGHSALYLGGVGKRIACHTYSRCDANNSYDQSWKSVNLSHIYTLVRLP